MGDVLSRLRSALAGRYTLDRELGRGGMATVWLAEEQHPRRHVALKVLDPAIAQALGPERFLREVDLAAKLTHPHILPIHSAGDADGLLYYTMPYVEGEALRDRLDREKQLPLDDALQIAREVADALSYAHSHDVVHRDIKPENILLESGHAVVADFGIARAITAAGGIKLTETGIAVGTPLYMSPEQAGGEATLDGRSDQYALATVVYEMLAGELPFSGRTAQALLARKLTTEPAPLSSLRPSVPRYVEEAVRCALARSPADRFPSVESFAAALRLAEAYSPSAKGIDFWMEPGTRRSVAVLPFASLTTESDDEYFSDGMTDEIITHLAKLSALKVISRASVMRFKNTTWSVRDIAQALGVSTLLTGSVRRSGTRLRITAQLVDACSDDHLWADTYDRDLTDVFAVQCDVAASVAAALRVHLTTAERARVRRMPTCDLEAYNLCLQGRHHWHRWLEGDLRRSAEYYEQAVARDPTCALAHAGRGVAYGTLSLGYWTVPAGAFQVEARESLARALEVDPELGEATAFSCWLDMQYDYAWEHVETRLREGIRLNPSASWVCDTYAGFLALKERHAEAQYWSEQALELDPLSMFVLGNAALNAHRGRDHARAVMLADRAIVLHPELPMSYLIKALALVRLGSLAGARDAAERARALQPGVWELFGAPVHAAAGDRPEARRIIRHYENLSTTQNVWLTGLAMAYAAIGDTDAAIARLEEAYTVRDFWVVWLRVQPELDPLRRDPRFEALLRRIGLG